MVVLINLTNPEVRGEFGEGPESGWYVTFRGVPRFLDLPRAGKRAGKGEILDRWD